MIIEVKMVRTKKYKLIIYVDSEGLSYLYSSVRFVAHTHRDVMYTSEEWLGELSAKSMIDSEGYLCSRFDLFPDTKNTGNVVEVRFSDMGNCCYNAGIVATSQWFNQFALKLQQLIDNDENESCFELESKIRCKQPDECNGNNDDVLICVCKAAVKP